MNNQTNHHHTVSQKTTCDNNELATFKTPSPIIELLPGYVEPSRTGDISFLESEGRHMDYIHYNGGNYQPLDFDDLTMSITLTCAMARINYKDITIHNPWKHRSKSELRQFPDKFLEQCGGKIIVYTGVKKELDEVKLLEEHICSCSPKELQNATYEGNPPTRDKLLSIGNEMGDGENNELKKKVSDGTVQVVPDNRVPICIFSPPPETPWMVDKDVEELKLMFENPLLWDGLVGGTTKSTSRRMYTRYLEEFPEMYGMVEKCMAKYIAWVQQQYPGLTHYKLAALKSYNGAKSQYEGCYKRLHSDFGDTVNTCPPMLRPVSLIVAIDDFDLMYLKDRREKREDIITQTIRSRQAVMFTNYCLHAGGACNSGFVNYRLFAYMASNDAHIPRGRVFFYDSDEPSGVWKRDDKSKEKTTNEITTVVKGTTTMGGRTSVFPNRYIPEEQRQRKKQKGNRKEQKGKRK